jgi:antitoxin CptB
MTSIPKPRLRWACRRGMKELELLLLPFFDEQFDTLTPELQADFERLLHEPDPFLYHWLLGMEQHPDPELDAMCKRIKEYQQTK